MRNQFKTPEEALTFLLEEGANTYFGYATVNLVLIQLGGGEATGYHRITSKTLENRIYEVLWCDDSVAIKFLDCIWIETISGRSLNDNPCCQIVSFPTIN